MKFTSILGETPYFLKPSELVYPSYFKDLNLDQITEHILSKWKDYPLIKYFYYPVKDRHYLLFRQNVLKEVSEDRMIKIITQFSRLLKKSRMYANYREELLKNMETTKQKNSPFSLSEKTAVKIKQQHFLFDSARLYTDAVTELLEKLGEYPLKSEGMLSFYEFLKGYASSDAFHSLYDDTKNMQQALGSLQFQMELTGTKLVLHKDYQTFDARREMMQKCGNTFSAAQEMKSPFTNILELEDFEGLLLSLLHKEYKQVFVDLEHFSEKHDAFYEPLLLQFEEEIQVYLAAGEFIKEMTELGFSFSYPELPENHSDPLFSLEGIYDLALACKHRFAHEKVISNDCCFFPGERFLVITGPNQGGKTTFARAVGQAVYFHQMGFPVAAAHSLLPIFSVLLTHFPVDEDVESGSGKLKEELIRLSPMLEAADGFVILNELFTTATTYDAEIMGKRILKDFMGQGFLGIYVTHLQELTRGQEGIVSMAALVDRDEKTRIYKIVRAEAKGLAYAQTIAEKYQLSREDIIKRVTLKT